MRRLTAILICLFLISSAGAQVPVTPHPNQKQLLQSDDPQLAANKKLVFDFWREVLVARHMDKAEQYMAEDYIQHNPTIPTGRATFMQFFGRSEPREIQPEIAGLVSIVAEGDLVVLSFRRELPDPANAGQTYTTTWFDMFRVENGKIAEHWDYGTKRAN